MDRRTRIARRWSFTLDAVAFTLTTANLDSDVVGGIIRLMCHAWGEGTSAPCLPADKDTIRRLSGCTTDEQYTRLSAALNSGPGYWVTDGERTWFPEQLAQYEKKAAISGKRARVGSRGGMTKAARQERDRVLAVTDADVIDGTWLKIREAYPKRRGDHSWKAANGHYRAAISRGVTPAALLAGVERYAAFVRAEGKEGTPWVKQARTFFGPERFYEDSWEFEPPPAPVPTTIAARMRGTMPVRA